ncbi:MAG: tripartite tricarboxylate transporter substrate-binding protein [Proteobacteria bacterium]|nr:tripartite tricarboxylate transporter substrate-binding protein [Pseudomonadota bacterium]
MPFPPGGTSDVLARMLQPKFSEFMGQPVVIDNKGGAAGAIGAAEVARAAPDGYTLMIVADPYAVMNHLYKQSPGIFASFDHVVMTTTSPSLLVASTAFAPGNVRELVSAAKAAAGAVTHATPGAGTFNHLSGLMLEQAADIKFTHVPYKGGGPMVQALLGGQVNIMFISAPLVMQQVKAGKLKPLAVGSRQRIAQLPEVPSLSETYPGISLLAWSGIVGPAGLPREAVGRINREMLRTLADPETRRRLNEAGFDSVGGTPEEFLAFVRSEYDKLGKVIRDNAIQVD